MIFIVFAYFGLCRSRKVRYFKSSQRKKHHTNSAFDTMRSISSDIGDIEAEILIPRKQKSNKIEMELMRLLSDLVLPTPEMIARKVEQSGNVISKQYLDLIEQMLTETTQLQRKGRKYKTKAHRAQRLATMSRVRKDPDSTAKKVISTGKNIINKIFG